METSADIQQPTCSNTSLVKRAYSKRAYSTRSPHKTQILNSPHLNSPQNSPQPKKVRNGVEPGLKHSHQQLLLLPSLHQPHRYRQLTISMENFELQTEEKHSLTILGEICEQYILLKLANEQNLDSLVGIQPEEVGHHLRVH